MVLFMLLGALTIQDLHALYILDSVLLVLWVSQELSSSNEEEKRVKWRQSVAISFSIDEVTVLEPDPGDWLVEAWRH